MIATHLSYNTGSQPLCMMYIDTIFSNPSPRCVRREVVAGAMGSREVDQDTQAVPIPNKGTIYEIQIYIVHA